MQGLTVSTNTMLEVTDLRQRRVLSACAEQVAERFECDASVAALVEQGEGFFVVCRCLLLLGL